MKTNKKIDREIFETFEVLTFFKFLLATFELIAGTLLLLIGRNNLVNFVISIARRELIEDNRDFFANYIVNLAQNFSVKTEIFIAIYLIIHGVVKLILLYGIWKKKQIAYPLSILVFSIFLFYQINSYVATYSIWLLVLSVLEFIYIALLIYEFKIIRERINHHTLQR